MKTYPCTGLGQLTLRVLLFANAIALAMFVIYAIYVSIVTDVSHLMELILLYKLKFLAVLWVFNVIAISILLPQIAQLYFDRIKDQWFNTL